MEDYQFLNSGRLDAINRLIDHAGSTDIFVKVARRILGKGILGPMDLSDVDDELFNRLKKHFNRGLDDVRSGRGEQVF
ncbi:MAG: hypothetical protein IBX64_09975 [Actinobacteria bacterium]|nr:hypothetical protein [Actinomycetota bacterium]